LGEINQGIFEAFLVKFTETPSSSHPHKHSSRCDFEALIDRILSSSQVQVLLASGEDDLVAGDQLSSRVTVTGAQELGLGLEHLSSHNRLQRDS
jgi:hypothetical protein